MRKINPSFYIIPAYKGNILPAYKGNILPVYKGNILPANKGNILPAYKGNILITLKNLQQTFLVSRGKLMIWSRKTNSFSCGK